MNEQTIFTAALEKPATERAAFLDEACGSDRELRQRVETLLRLHPNVGEFLERPAAGLPLRAVTEAPGTQIGPYKLLEQIGEGGMGVVFLAEQTQPVQRRVALKVIKPGLDSQQVIARFEAERQALALMDHANIARVLDAGETAAGRPYFVMELVQGVPITKYCDENRLSPRERLELFVPVCEAIQHAHQKGIIHRDIKPSNVMITLSEGKAIPKVIDFGVAKATEQKLTERTLLTHYGTLIGTLEYISPEQAQMSAQRVDTRSDIYSLGVLLYELLTGTTPLRKDLVKEVAFAEVLRLIKEVDPPSPSTRLSDSSESLPAISAQRRMEPAKLTKLVRGELDWIVMKALEKDRGRRYATANELAADVRRYLDDDPVQACPPSRWYRLQKLIRRNKGAVGAAVLLFVSLLAGIAGTTWGMLRADSARKDAVDAQIAEADRAEGERKAKLQALEESRKAVLAAEAEQRAKVAAEDSLRESQAVLEFVENKIIAAAGPEGKEGGLGRNVTLRQAVEASLPFVATGFKDEPVIEARLRMSLGKSFLYLGEEETAVEQLEISRRLFEKHLGREHRTTQSSMHNLAMAYDVLGRYDEALQLNQEALALRKATLGDKHVDTLDSMNAVADNLHMLGRYDEALLLCQETLALREASLGRDHRDSIRSMWSLVLCLQGLRRHADAIKLCEEVVERQKATFGPQHLDTLLSMTNLANSYSAVGRSADALRLREEVMEPLKAKLGPDHADTLLSMNNLANSYAAARRYAEALRLHEETLALRNAKFGDAHPEVIASMGNVALTYHFVGRHEEALKLREDGLALAKSKLGSDHPQTLICMHNLANDYDRMGRQEEAIKLREEALSLSKGKFGADHPSTLTNMLNLANNYDQVGRQDDGLKLREEALSLSKGKFGADHTLTLSSTNAVAVSYAQRGRFADALPLFEENLALQKASLGLDHPDTLKSMSRVAACLCNLDRGAQAVPIIDECVHRVADQVDDPNLIPDVMDLRLRHYQKIGDVAGCLETAGMWEDLKRNDVVSLYNSACFRAVCAAVTREADKTPAGEDRANAQADQAMVWLKQAVAAGFKDAVHIEQDKDLESLRDRDDFKTLLAKLKASP